MMKESKFVRTKIVVGYVLIALIGLTACLLYTSDAADE